MRYLLSLLLVTSLLLPVVGFAVTADDVVCVRCVGTTDLGDNSVTSVKILNGTILNADINATAAIDPTKILGTAWTGLNDGSVSGLDADLLDGVDSSVFLRNDTDGTIAGSLNMSGYVGIGGASLTKVLNIAAGSNDAMYITSDASDDWYMGPNVVAPGFGIYDVTQTASRLHIAMDGNVGIGTASPGRALEIKNADPVMKLNVTGGTADKSIYEVRGIGAAGSEGLEFRTVNDATTVFNTLMTLKQNGNVGIGTTSPGLKVDIGSVTNGLATSGSTATGGLRLHGATPGYNTVLDFGVSAGSGGNTWLQSTDATDLSQGYNLLLNPNGGNVGIGTTSPAKPLTVYAGSNDPLYLLSDSNHNWYVGPNVYGQRFGIYDATDSKLKMKIDSSGDMCFGACD